MTLKLGFAGTPAFAAAHLLALISAGHDLQFVITQPDKPGKRGKRPLASPVKQLAVEQGMKLLQPAHIRQCQREVSGLDLLIVVAYGQLLPGPTLRAPKLGCINVHASLLPRWRGAAPVERALEAGDASTGVTIMQMDEDLDTGQTLLQKEVSMAPDDTAETLLKRLAEQGPPLLLAAVQGLQEGRLRPRPQSGEGVTYAHKLRKPEAILDWALPASRLERQIRAYIPHPVATSFLALKSAPLRVRIWQAKVEAHESGEVPGTILAANREGIQVACGKDRLCIQKLQLPLGKGTVLTAADVHNARPELFQPGQRLVSQTG